MATSAPSCARRSAIARPIPWSPPVTAATLPVSRFDNTPPRGSLALEKEPSANSFWPLGSSGHGNFGTQVDVLNCVQQLNPFCKRPLKCLPTRDQPGSTCPLVDHRRSYCLLEIIRAGRTSTVDQACSPHETIRYLVAAQVDRVIARKFRVDAFVELAVARIAHVKG